MNLLEKLADNLTISATDDEDEEREGGELNYSAKSEHALRKVETMQAYMQVLYHQGR